MAAYVLFLNDIVGEKQVLNAKSLPLIKMPNRDGFVSDPRPDVPASPFVPVKSRGDSQRYEDGNHPVAFRDFVVL